MGFEDFCGNADGKQGALDVIRGMLARNRMPHALIFSGPPGVGKYTLAQMLAKALHCTERQNDFCGECRSCRSIGLTDDRRAAVEQAEQDREKLTRRPREVPLLLLNHPDVLLLPPNGPLRLFQIEQARHLKQALTFLPTGGGKKIFLLPEAERMDRAAANSLLKSLEEPPPYALLLLTTPNEMALLPTIRSRCVTIPLCSLPRRQVVAFLEKTGAGRDEQERILRAAVARGCPGLARRIDLEHYCQLRDGLLTILRTGLERKNFAELFLLTQKLAGKKEKLEYLLDVLYSLFQDILHIEVRASKEPLRNVDRASVLSQMARSVGIGEVMRASQALRNLEANLRRNVPTQIALDAFAVSMVPAHRISD